MHVPSGPFCMMKLTSVMLEASWRGKGERQKCHDGQRDCEARVGRLTGHLAALEDEAVFIIREVVATRERPVILFSAGKDSILRASPRSGERSGWRFLPVAGDARQYLQVILPPRGHRLSRRFTLILLACGWSSPASRDPSTGAASPRRLGPRTSRNALQSVTLLDAIAEHRFDAAFVVEHGATRTARAAERTVSVRDDVGYWNWKNQRPGSSCRSSNTRIERGRAPSRSLPHLELHRASTCGNTSAREALDVLSIYFAHARQVFERDAMPARRLSPCHSHGRRAEVLRPRFGSSCTVGDMTCTGAVRSDGRVVDEIIREVDPRHRDRARSDEGRRPTRAMPRWKTESERVTSDE